jgi:DNA topoisomerase VI subunit A
MAVVRDAISEVLKSDHPQNIRQIFYALVVKGVIEKTEQEYQGTVIRLCTEMRWNESISWDWIIDESRVTHETQTYDSIVDAVKDTAKFYRRSALRNCPVHIEILVEKAGLGSVIWDEAGDYDVPVVVTKGMPSLTQLYECSRRIAYAARENKETYLYQFGDHDPSGVLIPRVIENRLNEFCEKWDCQPPYIERVALTEEQIEEYNLPTRPTKRRGNSHARDFEGDSVELDALPARVLRDLVNDCINSHISIQQLSALRAAEDSEREVLIALGRKASKARR